MSRGFTLLETVMAAALGAVIVTVCASTFSMLDRAEVTLGRRAQAVTELGTVQKATQNALMSLMMSPRGASMIGTDDEDDPGDPSQAGFNLVFAEDEIDPRLLGEPRTVPVRDRLETQRFEMTLSRPPLPGLVPRRSNSDTDPVAPAAMRGAFELRPTTTEELPGPRGARRDKPLGMSLWWTPLDSATRETRLAAGLTVCQWKVFRDRERVDEFGVAYWHHLPAYVEMELETIDGIYATWLFEVDAVVAQAQDVTALQSPDEPEDDDQPSDDEIEPSDGDLELLMPEGETGGIQ